MDPGSVVTGYAIGLLVVAAVAAFFGSRLFGVMLSLLILAVLAGVGGGFALAADASGAQVLGAGALAVGLMIVAALARGRRSGWGRSWGLGAEAKWGVVSLAGLAGFFTGALTIMWLWPGMSKAEMNSNTPAFITFMAIVFAFMGTAYVFWRALSIGLSATVGGFVAAFGTSLLLGDWQDAAAFTGSEVALKVSVLIVVALAGLVVQVAFTAPKEHDPATRFLGRLFGRRETPAAMTGAALLREASDLPPTSESAPASAPAILPLPPERPRSP